MICPEHRWPSEDPVQALRGPPQLLPQAHCPCEAPFYQKQRSGEQNFQTGALNYSPEESAKEE